MFEDLEIRVKALATHDGKSLQLDLTHILSDRSFGEITDLIEEQLLKHTVISK